MSPEPSPTRNARLAAVAGAGLSVALFLAALAPEAVRYERVEHVGIMMAVLGPMGIMFGQVGWYANPFALLSLFLCFFARRGASIAAFVTAAIAFLIGATSWYTLSHGEMIGRNEGETAGDFVSFGPAIFLWTASLLVVFGTSAASVWLSPSGKK